MARGVYMRKNKKKDPLKQPPLSQAGNSGHERLYEFLDDKVLFWLLVVGLFGCVTWIQWIEWGRQKPIHPGVLTVVTVVLAIVASIRIYFAIKRARAMALGVRGEMVVGQQLEGLRTKGYRVYHDLVEKGFNIDHVLIGPGGVYVIETKTISKPGSGNPTVKYDGEGVLVDGRAPDRDPIAQAKANADRIVEVLGRATGSRPKVRAVVLFPGWWVERQRKGVEVWVLNPEAFVKFLGHEPVVLKSEEIALLSTALETYLRAAR